MRIGVIGAGAWGTTMAIHLVNNGHEVVLWERDPEYAAKMRKERENPLFLPSIRLPSNLEIASDGVGECDILVGAVPTQYLRGVLERIGATLPRRSAEILGERDLQSLCQAASTLGPSGARLTPRLPRELRSAAPRCARG